MKSLLGPLFACAAISLLFGASEASAKCVAEFINQSSSMEGGANPSYTMPRGKIIPQVTETVLTGGGYREERTFGPTQYNQGRRGPSICFYKDYCYPAKDINLIGCTIGNPDQYGIRRISPVNNH